MLRIGVIFDVRRDEPFHSVTKLWEGSIAGLARRFDVRVHEVDCFEIDHTSTSFRAFVRGLDALVLLSPYYRIDRTHVDCPVVCFALGSLAKGGHWLRRNAASFRPTDTLILSSTSCRGLLGAGLQQPAIVSRLVPFGVDDAVYRPGDRRALRTRLGLPVDKRLLVYSGRLSPQKNGVLLLQVMRDLLRRHKDIHLVMVGERDDFAVPDLQPHPGAGATFDAWCRRLGEHLTMVPHQRDPKRHAEVLASADIGVNLTTALGENFGFTQIEYQMCGLAVVCSDYGGLRDTVAHTRTGFRAPTTLTAAGVVLDVAAVRGHLERLLSDAGLLARMQAEAPEHAAQFGLARFEERLGEVVREAAERPQRREPLDVRLHPDLVSLHAWLEASGRVQQGIDCAHLYPRLHAASYRHVLTQVVTPLKA